MKKEGFSVSDATHEWVKEFNAVPSTMIERLMVYEPDDWMEVTLPDKGDRVYVYDVPGECNQGYIINISDDGEKYQIETDDGHTISRNKEDFEVEYDGTLPIWGTMWSFGDGADDWWLDHMDGIRAMSECGFRIYEHDEFGYFFGIDGAGFDFYESFWIPLYKARGLQWHDPETEKKAS
ncbi:MAG: hypothetical protein LUD12_13975 [Lachnospiraceae bacterium]|nr:hypothetical protein [Lachnospiraceae bacterium]